MRSHLNAFLSAFGSAFTPARSAASSSSPTAGTDPLGLVQPPPLTPQAAAARRMPLDSADSSSAAAAAGKSAAATTATVTATAATSGTTTARLRVGDRVRVVLPAGQAQPRYKWGAAVNAESVGTLRRLDADGDAIVEFPGAAAWRALATELQPVAVVAAAPLPLRVGARVRVVLPAGQTEPRYHWGSHVNAQSIGTVRSMSGSDARVDFPGASGWMALASELQVIDDADAAPMAAAASDSESEEEEDEEESDQSESEEDSDGDSD